MYEIDFLPVESEDGPGSKSGDAVCLRFTLEAEGRNAVVIIDGGFRDTGKQLAEHVREYYDTNQVDLVISTHPDADHINGLIAVLEELDVRELAIHQPRLQTSNVDDFSNIEAVDELLQLAAEQRIPVTEPFTGVSFLNGQVQILGPTEQYYEALVAQHLAEQRSAALHLSRSGGLLAKGRSLLERVIDYLPIETLTDDGEASPRNNMSAITMVHVDGIRLLFTGDAGIPALTAAADHYEAIVGPFESAPLKFFQIPHHGSRRNVGPTLLNRILGPSGRPYRPELDAFVSSAAADPKHPSPKVVNAVSRRGGNVFVTEGKKIMTGEGHPPRPGWQPMNPVGPLTEDGD